jgi:large subunit ribosomal protein L23
MDESSVIIKPLITEKSTRQQESANTYAFEVDGRANKQQIRRAVEKLYEVKVLDVRTMNRKGKPRRTKLKMAYTSDRKRAVVALHEDSKIELF